MKYRILDNEEEILQKIIEISSIPSNNKDNILKARFMQKLFFEYGIKDVFIDPIGNVVAKLPGTKDGNIVLFTDLESNNEIISKAKVTMRDITGIGVGTNSFPLYSLAALSKLLKRNKEKHKTIYFVCVSDGKSTFKGINYFLKNSGIVIDSMIYIRGLEEGRLEKSTTAYINCDLIFRDIDSNFICGESKNAIFYGISKLISKIKDEDIGEIFNFKIENISSLKEESNKYFVNLGVSAESTEYANQGLKILKEILEGIKSEENLIIEMRENYSREGVICKSDKLYSIFYEILKNREIKIYNISESSQISIPITDGIETVCVGIGKGGNFNKENEYIEIKSIYRGIELIYEAVLKYDDN